ncbi:Cytidine deaminase [Lachnospiraceae bacterium TWA4]|nr:Cytidine deaminase [Lachnospiraceae bacterium TWA4]
MIQRLIRLAMEARLNAYTPYSNFTVGAALLTTDGTVFTGCNVENAAFTPGNCAERTAVFKAVSEGYKEFEQIAIVGGKKGEQPKEYCSPCGVCRQVLVEFADPKTFQVIIAKSEEDYQVYRLEDLLPLSFGPESL